MSEVYKIRKETLDNIGDAIRIKAGKTDLISPLNMPEEILMLQAGNVDFSQQTATEENVEEGCTFFNRNGLLSTGTGLGSNGLSKATATENDVAKGKTFYAGDKTLKTGNAMLAEGNMVYYLNGSDECTSITGGWTDEGYKPTSYYPPQHTEYGLQFFDEANPNRSWHGTKTVNKIDVTDLATITFVVFSPNHFYVNYFYGGLYTENNTVYTSWAHGTGQITFSDSGINDPFYKVATLDVSEVTGSYYLGVYYYTYANRGDYGTYYGILTKVIGTTLLPTDDAPTTPISIISNGVINTPIEGDTVTKIAGTTTYKSGGYTQGSGYVETVFGTGKLNGLITKNKIDLTNYSTISITLTHEAASGYPTGENYGLSLLSYKNMSGIVTYKTNFKASAQTQTLTIDISKVTGVYHICCSSVDKTFKVTNWTIS